MQASREASPVQGRLIYQYPPVMGGGTVISRLPDAYRGEVAVYVHSPSVSAVMGVFADPRSAEDVAVILAGASRFRGCSVALESAKPGTAQFKSMSDWLLSSEARKGLSIPEGPRSRVIHGAF